MQDETVPGVIGVQSPLRRIVESGAPSLDDDVLANDLQVYPASIIAAPSSSLVVRVLCFSALQVVSVLAQACWHVFPLSPNTQLPELNAK